MVKFDQIPFASFFLAHLQFLPKQSVSTARGFFPQVAKLILRRCWGYALLPSQLRRVGRADKVVERRFAGGEGPSNEVDQLTLFLILRIHSNLSCLSSLDLSQ